MQEISRLFDHELANYPETYRPILTANRSRLIWQVSQIVENIAPGGQLLDIGAGIVPFMLICRKLGYAVTIIDDLGDSTYQNPDRDRVMERFAKAGVRFVNGDAFTSTGEAVFDRSYDLVTSHDSMEHWHNSPKWLFHRLWGSMPAGGLLWIGVPNSVNLRKRITVPFGRGKWSTMDDWYEKPVFRGHVREPDVGDLAYIARDLGASRYRIVGKNWIGYRHPSKFIRTVTPFVDRAMQLRPSLCTDINLLAWK